MQWHKTQVSLVHQTKGRSVGRFLWLVVFLEWRKRKLLPSNEVVLWFLPSDMTTVLQQLQCHIHSSWKDSNDVVKGIVTWLPLNLALSLGSLGFSKQFGLPGCLCRRQTCLGFQFTCGDFLIIGVLIESGITLAGEQQLADTPASRVYHSTSVHRRWKSLLHIKF